MLASPTHKQGYCGAFRLKEVCGQTRSWRGNKTRTHLLTTKNVLSPSSTSPLSSSICHVSGTAIQASCFTLVPVSESKRQNKNSMLLCFLERNTLSSSQHFSFPLHTLHWQRWCAALGFLWYSLHYLPVAFPLRAFGCKDCFSLGICTLPGERGPLSPMTFVGVLLILTTDSSLYC